MGRGAQRGARGVAQWGAWRKRGGARGVARWGAWRGAVGCGADTITPMALGYKITNKAAIIRRINSFFGVFAFFVWTNGGFA